LKDLPAPQYSEPNLNFSQIKFYWTYHPDSTQLFPVSDMTGTGEKYGYKTEKGWEMNEGVSFATDKKPLVGVIAFPKNIFNKLPPSMQCIPGKEGFEEGAGKIHPVVDTVPILITQGVNEMQSIANRVGDTQQQSIINKNSLKRLKSFYTKYKNQMQEEGRRDEAVLLQETATTTEKEDCVDRLRQEIRELQADTNKWSDLWEKIEFLEHLIIEPEVSKEIRILESAGEIVHCMGGARVVCCKSAKDRTSMSVTWSQTKHLISEHNINPEASSRLLELMRVYGVRRSNVILNTGAPYYAFNALQRNCLPEVFVPPTSSCSGKSVS